MLDRLAKQYFHWLVAVLLIACAYLQAQAITALIATHLLPQPDALAAVPDIVAMSPLAEENDETAQPIIERNPFDSFTGPLGREYAVELSTEPVVVDPLLAPKCEGVRVESTAVAMDPKWSSAVIQAPEAERGRLRRVGDEVGELKVAYIGYSRRNASPTVWLVEGEELCQAYVFDDEVKTLKRKKTKRRRREKRARIAKRPARLGPPRLPKQIANKIKRVGSTEFVVDRSAVDSILEQQAMLMKSVKLHPNSRNGKVESLSVARVRPNTLLGKLGIKNGDQIKAINGYSLTSPEKALEAYSRMRTASELNLEIVRRGKPLTILYRIQ